MPINRKWTLDSLIAAARDFPLRNRERITFEYVLLNGVNDDTSHAEEVVALLRGLRSKVNLIALIWSRDRLLHSSGRPGVCVSERLDEVRHSHVFRERREDGSLFLCMELPVTSYEPETSKGSMGLWQSQPSA